MRVAQTDPQNVAASLLCGGKKKNSFLQQLVPGRRSLGENKLILPKCINLISDFTFLSGRGNEYKGLCVWGGSPLLLRKQQEQRRKYSLLLCPPLSTGPKSKSLTAHRVHWWKQSLVGGAPVGATFTGATSQNISKLQTHVSFALAVPLLETSFRVPQRCAVVKAEGQ